MSTFTKRNFIGGLNSQIDPTKLDPQNEHFLGLNIRVRTNTAKPVRAPLEITAGLPLGHIQGLYTFDTTVLAFVGGFGYYQLEGSTNWVPIAGMQMSASVDEIDCELIPASTVNFVRKAPAGGTTQSTNSVIFSNPLASSPECVIVMDGVSQPWLIFPDGTARIVQTYAQWSPTNAEYVPIARYPLYVSGILYCVGLDLNGKRTQIYRSVTGRPIDYVILLDQNGNKISANETEGGAPVLSHRVSFNAITQLAEINAINGGWLACTQTASYVVTPDYNFTIAAEPTFSNQTVADVGAVTKNSIVPVLGDTTIICKTGIRSFNGVENFRWQGKNAPFSAAVNNFISNREQIEAAGVTFDDYALYALNTAFGPGILVFDMLLQKFVGLDIYRNVGPIKQFAKVQSGTSEKLYFYTTDDKLYQAFAGDTQRAEIYLCDLTPSSTVAHHRITDVYVLFSNIVESGYVESLVYSDRVYYNAGAQAITASEESALKPISVPFSQPNGGDDSQTRTFGYTDLTRLGWRATAGVAWNSDAELMEVGVVIQETESYAVDPAAVSQPIDNVTMILVGNDGSLSANRVTLNTAMQTVDVDSYIGCGQHTDVDGSTSDINTVMKPFWNVQRLANKFIAVPGGPDLDTTNGLPFYQYVQQGPNHYSKHTYGTYVDVFCITSGYNSAGTQVEASNLTQATIIASEQMQWLRTQLAASTAAYKIVIWYDTPYTSDPTITPRLVDIPLKAWGADLLVTGAGDMYERLVTEDAFTVVNVGTGGHSLYSGAVSVVPESRKIIQNTYGYLKIVANPLRLTCNFISTNNEQLDRFTI